MVVGEIARRHGDASALAADLAMADVDFSLPRLAKVYDALDPDRSDLDAYLALVDELGARSVLEIGCGTGTFACLLAAREVGRPLQVGRGVALLRRYPDHRRPDQRGACRWDNLPDRRVHDRRERNVRARALLRRPLLLDGDLGPRSHAGPAVMSGSWRPPCCQQVLIGCSRSTVLRSVPRRGTSPRRNLARKSTFGRGVEDQAALGPGELRAEGLVLSTTSVDGRGALGHSPAPRVRFPGPGA